MCSENSDVSSQMKGRAGVVREIMAKRARKGVWRPVERLCHLCQTENLGVNAVYTNKFLPVISED